MNRLTKFKIGITSFLLLLTTHTLYAATEGNGQGVFCNSKGRCISLAAAGMEIPEENQTDYYLTRELVQAVSRLIDQLPLSDNEKKSFVTEVVGVPETFKRMKKAPKKLMESAQRDYKKIFKDSADDFTILAISDDNSNRAYQVTGISHTYLLPKFFQVDLELQALTLIHEASVRGKASGHLKTALELDREIYQFLNNPSEFNARNFYTKLNTLYRYDVISEFKIAWYLMSEVILVSEYNLRWDDLCHDSSLSLDFSNRTIQECHISYQKILMLPYPNLDKSIGSYISKFQLESSYNGEDSFKWRPLAQMDDEEFSMLIVNSCAQIREETSANNLLIMTNPNRNFRFRDDIISTALINCAGSKRKYGEIYFKKMIFTKWYSFNY